MPQQDAFVEVNDSGFSQVGSLVRQARERKAKTLPEVATELRIRAQFLEAIEGGRFAELPGSAYASGFVRAYAEYLELDGEEILRQFREESGSRFSGQNELVFPSPVSEGRIPGGAYLFMGLVLAVLVYGAWSFLSSREVVVADLVPEVPDRLTALLRRAPPPPAEGTKADGIQSESPVVVGGNGNDEGPKPLPALPAPATPAPLVESTSVLPLSATQPQIAPVAPPSSAPTPAPAPIAVAEASKVEAVTPPPAPPAAPVPVTPAPVAPAAVAPSPSLPLATESPAAANAAPPQDAQSRDFGADNASTARFVLHATGDSWIQVRDGGNHLVTARLLHKGDSYSVPNRPDLSLMTGNAGALEVTLDGKPLPPLGAVAQVRRDIALDPAKFGAKGN